MDDVLRLGLVFHCWPLTTPPDQLPVSMMQDVIRRTDMLLANEQERRRSAEAMGNG